MEIDYAEKARQYLDDGFCVIEDVLKQPLLDELREVTDRLIDGLPEEHLKEQRSTGSMISVFAHPALARIVALPEALEAMHKMGFYDIRFSSGYVISKPPRSPRLFWHFDWMGWDHPASYERGALQTFFMYYLTDTTPSNGCLRVLPCSHIEEHPLHALVHEAHTPVVSRAENLDLPEFSTQADEVDVPVKAGDLVVGDSRVFHAAHANNSDKRRTVITLWMHPNFRDLPEPLQAYASRVSGYPDNWPAEARALLDPLIATYDGAAEAPLISRARMSRDDFFAARGTGSAR